MFNNNAGNNLPVACDQVYQNQFVGNNIPYPPQTPVSGQMPQNIEYGVHATLIGLLEYNSTASAVRAFMFNLASSSGYQNQYYAELLGKALEYYRATSMIMGNTPQYQDIVEETIRANMPDIVNKFPAIQQYLDQNQLNTIQQLNQVKNKIINTIQQSSRGNAGMGNNMMPNNNMGGGMMPNNNMMPSSMMGNNNNTVGGAFSMPNNNMMGNNMMPNNNMGGGMNTGGGWGFGNNTSPTTTPTTPPSQFGSFVQPTTSTSAAPAAAPTQFTPKPDNSVGGNEMPGRLDRELAHELSVQNTKNHLKQNVDDDLVWHSILPIYRKGEKIVFRRNPDGSKEYAIVDKDYEDPSMSLEYENLEEEYELMRRQTEKAAADIPEESSWSDVTAPTTVNKDTDIEKIEPFEPVVLDEAIDAYSIAQADAIAIDELKELGVNVMDHDNDGVSQRTTYEYIANIKTPLKLHTEELETITYIADAVSLTDLRDRMDTVSKDDDYQLRSEIWYRLHDIVKQRIHEAMHYGLGLDPEWRFDDFITDYDDLLEALSDEVTQSGLDRWKEYAYHHAIYAITTRKSTDEIYINEKVSVTSLNWTSESLDMVVPPRGYGILTNNKHIDIVESVRKLYGRCMLPNRTANIIYLRTLDNIWIRIYKSVLGNDYDFIVVVD